MRKLYINGTIQEIETLESAAQNAKGKIAILYDSLKRASEILHSLSIEEFEQLQKESESHPVLKSIVSNAVTRNTVHKEETVQFNLKTEIDPNLPGFLTVNDAAELLSISPQSVRKYCKSGRIQAWRTLGDSGEWRIDIEPYKTHPNIEPILEKYRRRNRGISEMVANSSGLIRQFQLAKERRNDPSYYHNDIERFYKMVDEDDE